MANSSQKARAANLSNADSKTEGAINRAFYDWGDPFKDEPGPRDKQGGVNFELWATWRVFVSTSKSIYVHHIYSKMMFWWWWWLEKLDTGVTRRLCSNWSTDKISWQIELFSHHFVLVNIQTLRSKGRFAHVHLCFFSGEERRTINWASAHFVWWC